MVKPLRRLRSNPSTSLATEFFHLQCLPQGVNIQTLSRPASNLCKCAMSAPAKQDSRTTTEAFDLRPRILQIGLSQYRHPTTCPPNRSQPVSMSDHISKHSVSPASHPHTQGVQRHCLPSRILEPQLKPSMSDHVLMGAFPVSRRHVSLATLVYILWRRMHSTS